MRSRPRCRLCIFEGLFLEINSFKIDYRYILEEFLLTFVLDTKRAQLVPESFSYLIYVPEMNLFYSSNKSK